MTMFNGELKDQLTEVEKLLQEVENKLKTYKNLEPGSIRMASSHGCKQFYFRKARNGEEEYISTLEKERIQLLAQRDYEEKVHRTLIGMKNRLTKFLAGYDINVIDEIYEKMCETRKNLVIPIVPTESMIIEEWMEEHRGGENTYGEANTIKTLRGEYVRSKSEKILADYFYNNHIPYQYEPRFEFEYYRNVYPDFVIYNVRKRKTIYWEHLGLVDEADYALKNFRKLMDYEKSGLVLGDNLIVTFETKEQPLDVSIVEKKVTMFLI